MQAALALYQATNGSTPTATHHFLRNLQDKGRLRRLYTQNVDGLEDAVGLKNTPGGKSPSLVQLHGSIRSLRCVLCCSTYPWSGREALVSIGEDLYCPRCETQSQNRVSSGKRRTAVGALRPAILCSDEQHPQGEEIERLIKQDERTVDLFIILGTSLSFDGPATVARRLANATRKRSGSVIYVNSTKPRKRVSTFADYWVSWTCDSWVLDLQKRDRRSSLKACARRDRGNPNLYERLQSTVSDGIECSTSRKFRECKEPTEALDKWRGNCPEFPIILE